MENIVGERIREVLKLRKMTQKNLAELVHVSPITMNRYLKGERKIPSDILKDISDKTGADVRFLLGEVDNPMQHIADIIIQSKKILDGFDPEPQRRLDKLFLIYGFKKRIFIENNDAMVSLTSNNGETSYVVSAMDYSALATPIDLTIRNVLVNYLEFCNKKDRKDNTDE